MGSSYPARAVIAAAATRVLLGGGSSSSSRTGSSGSHGTAAAACRRLNAYPKRSSALSSAQGMKGQQHLEGEEQRQSVQSCSNNTGQQHSCSSSDGQEAQVSSSSGVTSSEQAQYIEMLYDACGALPCEAEAAGTRNQRPKSDQAVLEVAGWVVLPFGPRQGAETQLN
jgi:hypothetical protein